MVQPFYQDGVPGAYITKTGIPSGATQLPVYNMWDRHNPDQPDVLSAFFLLDAHYEAAVRAIPSHGVWRIHENNTCTFATAWQLLPDKTSRIVRLHEEIFRLSVINRIPEGFRVVVSNFDWYDVRACNLRLRRTVPLAVQRERGLIRQRDTRG